VDARDVEAAFRPAVANETIESGTYLLSADDAMSRVESQVLLERFFPDVPVTEGTGGHDTLVSHPKATRELGWVPRHSWRE
jgi:hypothetical protein